MKKFIVSGAMTGSASYGGNYSMYSNFIELESDNLEDVIKEVDRIQNKHDNEYIEEFGEYARNSQEFNNAPCYIANLYEVLILVDEDGEEYETIQRVEV